jgi:hypothetical protein
MRLLTRPTARRRIVQRLVVSAVTAAAAASTGCYALGGGKTNCYAWFYNTPTYSAPGSFLLVGWLNQGWNYVYCQTPGASVTEHGYTNRWWLKTDDDAHHHSVWVNALYISSGSNNQPIPGVPRC